MFCQNCGCKLDDDALFCPNCGKKMTNEEIYKIEKEKSGVLKDGDRKSDITKPFNVGKKKKKVILSSFLTAVVLVMVGVLFYSIENREVKIEASTLGSDINEGKANKYKNKELEIHGYLIRDVSHLDDQNYYYSLAFNLDDEKDINNQIVFSVNGGLDTSLGTGSELIIKGKVRLGNDDYSTIILVENSEDISVKNIVSPVFEPSSVEDLLNNFTKYIDKEIMVTGVISSDTEDMLLCNKDYSSGVTLVGISTSEILSKVDLNTWVTVKGQFTVKGQNFTLDVESIDNNEIMNELYPDQVCNLYEENGSYSVDEVLDNPNCFLEKHLTIYGIIPPSQIKDESGNIISPLYADDRKRYICLEGDTYPYPWDSIHSFYTGTLYTINGKLTLEIDSY